MLDECGSQPTGSIKSRNFLASYMTGNVSRRLFCGVKLQLFPLSIFSISGAESVKINTN
jgi:hypothetical protein